MQQFKSVALAAILVMGTVSVANAEGINDLANNVAQKAAVISALQSNLAMHQSMTEAQIKSDLTQKLDSLKDRIQNDASIGATQANGIDQAVTMTEQALAGQSKDVILAIETTQIQQVMVSANILMWLTKQDLDGISELKSEANDERSYGGDTTDSAWGIVGLEVLMPLAVVTDIGLFPATFIASALTGF